MPPPNGVDKSKWAAMLKQFISVGELVNESTEEHLKPESVCNVLNEAVVGTRKLAVELESVMAVARRSGRKEVPA